MNDGENEPIERIHGVSDDDGGASQPLLSKGDGLVMGQAGGHDTAGLDDGGHGSERFDWRAEVGHGDQGALDAGVNGIEVDIKRFGELFSDFPIEGEIAVRQIAKKLGVIVRDIEFDGRIGVGDVVSHRGDGVVPHAEFFRKDGDIDEEGLGFVPGFGKFVCPVGAQAHLGVHGVLHPHGLDIEEELVEFADLQDGGIEVVIFGGFVGKNVVVGNVARASDGIERLREGEFAVWRQVFAGFRKEESARNEARIVGRFDGRSWRMNIMGQGDDFTFTGHKIYRKNSAKPWIEKGQKRGVLRPQAEIAARAVRIEAAGRNSTPP